MARHRTSAPPVSTPNGHDPGQCRDDDQLSLSIFALSAASCAISSAISSSFARSEEHTSELQSLMRISYAVFCLKKKKKKNTTTNTTSYTTVHSYYTQENQNKQNMKDSTYYTTHSIEN